MNPNLIKSVLFSIGVHFSVLMPFVSSASVSTPPTVDLAAGTSSVELEWIGPAVETAGSSQQTALKDAGEEALEEIRQETAAPDSWIEDAGVERSAVPSGTIANPAPLYPRVARVQGWEGTTMIRVLVNPSGGVASARIAQGSGHEMLDGAALAAVRQWRFQPARKKGQAVASQVEIPIKFRLKDQTER